MGRDGDDRRRLSHPIVDHSDRFYYFPNMLRYLTSGESHGPQLTVIVDGFPAGFHLDTDKINHQLERRQRGFGRGERMKIEKDSVDVVSGVRGGVTLGSPITFVIKNKDWDNWKGVMDPVKPAGEELSDREKKLAQPLTRPRPGHADLPGAVKFGHRDLRNVLERASARETAVRVAAGGLARQLLEHFGVRFASHVRQIGKVTAPADSDFSDLEGFMSVVEKSQVRCFDSAACELMVKAIEEAKSSGDSLGGVVEVIIRGMPAGLGGFSQASDRLDSRLAAAMMSIPSVKGVEIGLGFKAASHLGSEVQDEIFHTPGSDPARRDFYRKSNNAGGMEGGITNGEDIIIRFAVKPISTLPRPLKTVDLESGKPAEALIERADCCIVPVLGVIGEACAGLVLADVFMDKFGSDNLSELERNYKSFLKGTI